MAFTQGSMVVSTQGLMVKQCSAEVPPVSASVVLPDLPPFQDLVGDVYEKIKSNSCIMLSVTDNAVCKMSALAYINILTLP